jgi:hypothetical protein
MSLKSLQSLHCDRIAMVYIVVDSKEPFGIEQQASLKEVVPNLQFLELGPVDWASLHTLKTEIQAFAIAASRAQPVDFIAKVDSDILFFSSTKLEEIGICRADFVGDGHTSGYRYAQGGLYLLRVPLAKQLKTVTEQELEQTIAAYGTPAEDLVMTALVRRRTRNIWLTRLMLFPDEVAKANLNRRWVRQEFSAMHFVHRKSDMPTFASRLGLG